MEIFKLLFLFSFVIAFVSTSLVGFFLLFTVYRKDPAARAFANLSFSLSIWEAFLFFASVSTLDFEFRRVLFLLSGPPIALVGLFFFDFANHFSRIHSGIFYKRLRYIAYTSAFFFSALFFSDIFFNTRFMMVHIEVRPAWFAWPVLGPFFHLYMVHFFVTFGMGFLLLWRLRRRVAYNVKSQINYVFWTSAIAAIGGSSLWLLWYNLPFPPIGAFFLPIYVFGVLYTITRFHLFNFKVITAELFTIFIWMIMMARMFVAKDFYTLLLDSGVLLLTIFFGILTIRSVLSEVRQKENLKNLNQTLEERVREQTKEVRTAYEVEKKARVELEHLNQAKNEFILGAQHNLRTPLTVAKGYVEEINLRVKEGSADVAPSVDKTAEALESMSKVVNKLLDITELKAGKNSDSSPKEK